MSQFNPRESHSSKTVPFMFSADGMMVVGGDLAMPVTDDYSEDDVSHLEPLEVKYHRTLARQ